MMANSIGARLWLARSDAAGSEFCVFVPERRAEEDDGGGDDPGSAGATVQSITARV